MENQPAQEPRKKQSEGERLESTPPPSDTPSTSSSLAGAAIAGAAAGALGSMGAELIKDLFSDASAHEPSASLSGVATEAAEISTPEPEKMEEAGLASSIAQHITEVTEDKIPPPPPRPAEPTSAVQLELNLEPEPVQDFEQLPGSEPIMQVTPPTSEPNELPSSSLPHPPEAVEFGGHRMELDNNEDGKIDQMVWDVNQDSFADVIGTDTNQDSIIASDEIKIINDLDSLQKPEEVADPSVIFVDFNQDNQPEAMLMDINNDQRADMVIQQGPPTVEYEGEVAGNIPEDVDPSAENEHRQDLSKLDDPFSDLNQWV
jgi:hypothetical protein